MASNATTGVIPDATAFQNVGTLGVVFSALSALFGVYVVIFSLAVWLTFRRAGALYRNLRIVSIGLFTVLLAHYICRGIIFSQSRIINPPQDMLRLSTIPLSFIAAVTSTLAGLISDGLLAWRFYVVYGRHPWALWIPMSMIILNTCLGLAANFQILAFYSNEQKYLHFYQLSVLKVDVAWCWFTFAINTALTGAISGKIIYISQTANKDTVTRLYGGGHHNTALLAVVESALVTWIGLLMYGIASIAPTGGVTQALNVGFVMACIIPIFFVRA
ncbi:hypothetical protein BC629DRAFT_1595617 [Irpex lacteus]|nr:hypothetical protein BC629DRAFT_1595617 [Irpex lacteus]